MPAGTRHVPDPEIQFGHFRVYQRTDGKWIVSDLRRKVGTRTVMQFKRKQDAVAAAQHWHEGGHG